MNWTCKDKCGECCGTITISDEVFNKNSTKMKSDVINIIEVGDGKKIYETKDGLCLFLTPNKECAIYGDRPDVCRRYGIDTELPCPYIKPNGNLRSLAKIKRTQRQIDHKINDTLKIMKKYMEKR